MILNTRSLLRASFFIFLYWLSDRFMSMLFKCFNVTTSFGLSYNWIFFPFLLLLYFGDGFGNTFDYFQPFMCVSAIPSAKGCYIVQF